MKTNWINGQILGEAVVAMGIITVSILAFTGVLARSMNEGRYISNKITAVNLAGEGIEIARNILDGNAIIRANTWNQGFNAHGFFEADFRSEALTAVNVNNLRVLREEQIGGVTFYSYNSSGAVTNFRRSIQIEPMGLHQIRVTARVFWDARAGRINEVVLVSDFYNWR